MQAADASRSSCRLGGLVTAPRVCAVPCRILCGEKQPGLARWAGDRFRLGQLTVKKGQSGRTRF